MIFLAQHPPSAPISIVPPKRNTSYEVGARIISELKKHPKRRVAVLATVRKMVCFAGVKPLYIVGDRIATD